MKEVSDFAVDVEVVVQGIFAAYFEVDDGLEFFCVKVVVQGVAAGLYAKVRVESPFVVISKIRTEIPSEVWTVPGFLVIRVFAFILDVVAVNGDVGREIEPFIKFIMGVEKQTEDIVVIENH